MQTLWSFVYWINFAFSWLVLPFFMYYEDSGEFSISGRIKRSLIENLIYYLYFGVAVLPLLIFTYSMGLLSK